jgi:cytochrome c oxidase assembly protein subunit 15
LDGLFYCIELKLNPLLQPESRWPHRLAVVLVCATFPLIWVGGLVTTYDAGMAVPDWPTTYGYNLFLYPWTTWIAGPWDLFIEHGHRLLGALVGMLTIALAVAVFWRDARRWMRFVAVAALCLVITQGVIGGQRVIQDERLLAKLHGCLGPLFFAVATALAVFTSRLWKNGAAIAPSVHAAKLHRLALFTAMLAYAQLVLGANLRHVPVTASVQEFRAALYFHLAGAAAVAVHVVLVAIHVRRRFSGQTALVRPAWGLVALLAVQVALGVGSWVVKYSIPANRDRISLLQGFTIENEGLAQSLIVTAHTAGGSLILALSVVLALRAWRLAPRGMESAATSTTNQYKAVDSAA